METKSTGDYEETTTNYSFRWWHLFLSYILIYMCITWLTNISILTESYYYSAFGTQIGSDRVAALIEMNRKFQWIGYIVFPLLLLIKWLLLSAIIYSGLFLFNQNISFNSCFKIIMVAELAVVAAALIKLLYFLFIHHPETTQDIQFFYPLSVTQLLNLKQLPAYLIYPLQQFNLFEVAYWLLIAAGIQAHIQKSFSESLKIVASSYGVALSIWIVFVVFIQVQFT